jgi:uncharacterized protein YbbC (DUF1343 family)
MKLSIALLCCATVFAQERYEGSAAIDQAIQAAVNAGEIPGAVCIVGKPGRILHRAAYGSRALVPAREPMTVDTIFDIASLSKVVGTTSAIMKLFEEGKVRLNDPVTRYLPQFQGGTSAITVRQLLTHFSGLRPDLDLEPAWSGYELGVTKALADRPALAPSERFVYSDINFILLGEMVRQLTGKPLDQYVQSLVFDRLGMRDTMYNPPASLRPRIAPTELDAATGLPFRGVVHDETTRFMGGVAGHAGVFSTASDLAIFAEMMLRKGMYQGQQVFSPAVVQRFTEPNTPAGQATLRGLGWDIDSAYSSNRGELFPIGSFGHTGFTGTSMWMDPVSQTYVILLTNSVHPRRGRSVNSLRSRVATIAAVSGEPFRNGDVSTGLDMLSRDGFAMLRGKTIGLITNHTGLTKTGQRNVDVMRQAGVNIAALFSPEHGIAGAKDENVASSRDEATGLPVHSLYDGANRRPNDESLKGIDTLVFDIQDIGARFYTYSCTLVYALEEAGKRDLSIIVLDRPNPITGTRVEGPMIEEDLQSFVGCHSLPVRHGMTLGELARMVNQERNLKARLEVVKMEGWQRSDWFDFTGLQWVNPSPNMRSLNAATLYPGLALFEYSTNYSVGRGTDSPFEQIGAEWIKGRELAAYLNSRGIAGVRFYGTSFTSVNGKPIEGIRVVVTNREILETTKLGMEIAAAQVKLYPGRLALEMNAKLIGNRQIIQRLASGEDPRLISGSLKEAVGAFLERRKQFLLY